MNTRMLARRADQGGRLIEILAPEGIGDPVEPAAREQRLAELELPAYRLEVTSATRTSERQGRVIDHDPSASMEKKKQEGYF